MLVFLLNYVHSTAEKHIPKSVLCKIMDTWELWSIVRINHFLISHVCTSQCEYELVMKVSDHPTAASAAVRTRRGAAEEIRRGWAPQAGPRPNERLFNADKRQGHLMGTYITACTYSPYGKEDHFLNLAEHYIVLLCKRRCCTNEEMFLLANISVHERGPDHFAGLKISNNYDPINNELCSNKKENPSAYMLRWEETLSSVEHL